MREPLNLIKESFVCAEVGVWKGDFSQAILNRKPSALHLIDPWVHQDYVNRLYSTAQEKMDSVHRQVCNKFKDRKEVTIHRAYSTEVKFEEGFFDWLYLDADHSYESVKKDLEHFAPLIKKGGYLTGDDYGWTDANCNRGPKPAIDEFAEERGVELRVYPRRQFALLL